MGYVKELTVKEIIDLEYVTPNLRWHNKPPTGWKFHSQYGCSVAYRYQVPSYLKGNETFNVDATMEACVTCFPNGVYVADDRNLKSKTFFVCSQSTPTYNGGMFITCNSREEAVEVYTRGPRDDEFVYVWEMRAPTVFQRQAWVIAGGTK